MVISGSSSKSMESVKTSTLRTVLSCNFTSADGSTGSLWNFGNKPKYIGSGDNVPIQLYTEFNVESFQNCQLWVPNWRWHTAKVYCFLRIVWFCLDSLIFVSPAISVLFVAVLFFFSVLLLSKPSFFQQQYHSLTMLQKSIQFND